MMEFPDIPDGWPAMLAYFVGALLTVWPKIWSRWSESEDADKARLERSNDGLLLGRDKLIEEADKAREDKIEMLERVAEIHGKAATMEAERDALIAENERLKGMCADCSMGEQPTAEQIAEEVADMLDARDGAEEIADDPTEP